MNTVYNISSNKKRVVENKTIYLPATKSDINRLFNKMDDIINTQKKYNVVNDDNKTTLLTPTHKLFELSKFQKRRVLILLFSSISTGILITHCLINRSDTLLLMFYLSITLSALGTTISSLWSLMKGKKYDERIVKKNI